MVCLALERFLNGNKNFKYRTNRVLQNYIFKGDYPLEIMKLQSFEKLQCFENYGMYKCFGESFQNSAISK